VITDCPSGGRRVALSFDDGPSKNVDDILAQLQSYNATATFFVNGPDGQDWTGTWEIASEILQRTHAQGHLLASHTQVKSLP
jgi:peptidoglycan-N-acetylglucosamine deacetylase